MVELKIGPQGPILRRGSRSGWQWGSTHVQEGLDVAPFPTHTCAHLTSYPQRVKIDRPKGSRLTEAHRFPGLWFNAEPEGHTVRCARDVHAVCEKEAIVWNVVNTWAYALPRLNLPWRLIQKGLPSGEGLC